MRVKKVVLFIIAWAILGFAILAFLQTAKHPRLNRIRVAFKDSIGSFFDNLLESVLPPARKKPLVTIELEARLKANLPVPFVSFKQQDWQWFWQLLYGRYPVDSSGWPKRMKQLSKEEIEAIFVDNYSQPFGYFRQQQWDIFWRDILKGRVF